jgi:uncharacterized protein (DUF2141 family)
MRRTFPALVFTAATLFAGTASAADLTVELHGIRAQTGTIRLAVVDGQAGWDGKARPVAGNEVAPDGNSVAATFKGLAPGNYAVLVTHDENGNGKLDTNLIGMPTEGYGFSNNPRVMRKPTWDEARFELGEADATVRIELR